MITDQDIRELEEFIGTVKPLYVEIKTNVMAHYPDYAYNHPLFDPKQNIYSDSTVSKFINQISKDDSINFQNKWNELVNKEDKIYISYDSTNKTSDADDIDFVEVGHSKDGPSKPIINYSIAFDTLNSNPLFYEEYPGSIVDVSELKVLLEKAKAYGYKNMGFILDRGYFSKENIHYMDKNNYDFIIMCKGKKKLVKKLVLDNKGKFEDKRSTYIKNYDVNGITVKAKLFESDNKDRYFHIYCNPRKYSSEKAEFNKRLNLLEDNFKKRQGQNITYPESLEEYCYIEYYHKGKEDQVFQCASFIDSVIEGEIKTLVYYVIITSSKMTASKALELYKGRDVSEKLFKADKSFLGYDSYRVHSDESLVGKSLIEFVALIIRNKLYKKIHDQVLTYTYIPNYMNVVSAIKEFEKIEIIKGIDNIYRLDHALTKTQKDILKSFDINTLDINKSVKKISERLNVKYITIKRNN